MISLPNQHKFAFTIVDDTDDATLENIRPVYDFLLEKNMRITKTIWPKSCPEGSGLFFAGECLENNVKYLEYVQYLETQGVEIASHGATMEGSKRERTSQGLDFIDSNLKSPLRLHCNHAQNRENLYWGYKRFNSFPWRQSFQLLNRMKNKPVYSGDTPDSDYFWGDICQQRIKYLRNFTFHDLNIFNATRLPIYSLRQTPWANNWFITSDAPNVHAFTKKCTKAAVDKLIAENGICIMSTHLGKGYYHNKQLNPHFRDTIDYITKNDGWFVPASTLMDYIQESIPSTRLTQLQLMALETKYVTDQILNKIYGR